MNIGDSVLILCPAVTEEYSSSEITCKISKIYVGTVGIIDDISYGKNKVYDVRHYDGTVWAYLPEEILKISA